MFRALCCCLDDDDDDDATRDASDLRRRDRDALGGVIADEDDVGTTTTTVRSLRRMMIVDGGDDDDEGGGDDTDDDDEDGDRLLPRASRRSDTDGAFFRDEARAAAALERSESAPPRGAKVSRSDGDLDVGEDGKEEAMRRWVSETERRMETHRRAASAGIAGVGGAARDATRTKKDDSRTATRRSETVDYDNSCPTCFEAYEEENPRIALGCGHHFHLACILSWQEYSAATHPSRESGCPACDAPIEFKEAL